MSLSLFRYSAGTSSSGTSRVLTSDTSGGLASSAPSTASASNVFPSSTNSSTLSESASATSENCRRMHLRHRREASLLIKSQRLQSRLGGKLQEAAATRQAGSLH